MLTYNVELDGLSRSQVDDLELLSFCEVPLREAPSQFGDTLRALRRSWLVVRGEILDGLQHNHVYGKSAPCPQCMLSSRWNSPQPRRSGGSHRHRLAVPGVLKAGQPPLPPF